ncbi:MAG: dTDP-4-dehydrorhamnose reductase [Nitrolancea sp.]
MRVMITGGNGQLGRALARTAQDECVTFTHAELDVADFEAVQRAAEETRPNLIIHAGAMTNVDGCERDPNAAFRANALGTQNVAAVASNFTSRLVYMSTNFVFDGAQDDPYDEFAEPRPISVYGASKLAGEIAVRAVCPRHYIVRTAMVYDESGRNFVNTMLRLSEDRSSLRVVGDQFGNPTYAEDLAVAIWKLVELPAFGTYHLTNSDVASWYEWAVETFRLTGKQVVVESIPASEYPRAAAPPRNGVLANHAASALGITLPDWRDGLARCLGNRGTVLADG